MSRDNRPLRLVDVELHPVELAQEVVGELDVGLVDLVDQHDRGSLDLECLPQHAALDVMGDVGDVLVAQLRIAQPRHGVVFVEALLRLGRRLDVPLQERPRERARDFLGEHRLAGAGLALDEQRPLERDRRVDGEHQVGRGNVGIGAFEAHGSVIRGRKKPMLAEIRGATIAAARALPSRRRASATCHGSRKRRRRRPPRRTPWDPSTWPQSSPGR